MKHNWCKARFFLLVCLLLSAFGAAPTRAAPGGPTFFGLGIPAGYSSSIAKALNNDGTYVVGDVTGTQTRAFAWYRPIGGKIGYILNLPAGYLTMVAHGISGDDLVVGQVSNGSVSQAFVYYYFDATLLGFLPGFTASSEANGANYDASLVVGTSYSSNSSRAVRWYSGGVDNLGVLPGYTGGSFGVGIADSGEIAGTSCAAAGGACQAFLYSNGTMQGLGFLPGDNSSEALAISRGYIDGGGPAIVGTSSNTSNISTVRAFVTDAFNIPRELGNLGGPVTYPFGVNKDGSVVVGSGYTSSQGGSKAFRWTAHDGMKTVEQLLTAAGVDFTGWSLEFARAVSDDGTIIVGVGTDPNGNSQAWFAQLPLPAGTLQIFTFDDYTITGHQGGPFSPASFSYSLSTDYGAVEFTIPDVPDWLTPSVVSGTATTTPTVVTFTVNAQAATRAVGTYNQLMTFTNLTNGNGTDVRTTILKVLARTATHDFDLDGKSDILWRDTGGNVAIWEMNTAQVSSSVFVGNVPTTWSIVGQRDFDGDGKADIIWHDTSGNVAVWPMNGATVLSSNFVSNVPTSWSIAGTADFNGDGKADILWRDNTGNVAIWLMNGGTVSSNLFVSNVPISWLIVGASGKDIFWRDTNGNTAVWIMNGGTVSSNVFLGNVPTTWSIVGTGDFSGDGNVDILWRDNTGNVAVWMLDSLGNVISNVFVANVPTTWSIAETGDFNGDGKSDILWHDNSGNTAIWLMNGGTVSSNLFVSNVPTAWSIQGAGAD